MDYYPSDHEIQMHKFFAKRRVALFRIKKLGLSMPYISEHMTYEQLLGRHIISDISNNETDYLKNGILELFKCLKTVQNNDTISNSDAEKEIFRKDERRLSYYIKDKGRDEFIDKYIKDKVESLISEDINSKKTTEEVLIQEISEFKIRLGRVNISVVLDKEVIDFKESDKMKELHINLREVGENPYPDIFSGWDAFVLFERLHSIFKNNNQNLADYSFIYRKMVKDNFILESFRPERFRVWIGGEKYNISTDAPLKTLSNCTTQLKEDLYETLKTIR